MRLFIFQGKLCIEVSPADKIAFISEELCIGCGICSKVKKKTLVLLIMFVDTINSEIYIVPGKFLMLFEYTVLAPLNR